MKQLLPLLFICFSLACARPDYISQEEWQRLNNPASSNEGPWAFKKLNIHAKLQWMQTPNSTDAQEFLLDLQGDLSQIDDLAVILWMPSMGHGSAPVKIERLSESQFRVTRVYFIMPGDWEIRMTLKKSGQVLDQLFIPLMVP